MCKKKKFDIVDEKYCYLGDNCHYTGKHKVPAHSMCKLRYKTPKEIPIVLQNRTMINIS